MRPHIHTRRDSIAASLTARELRSGYEYADACERGAILADIETYARGLSSAEQHEKACVPPRAFHDGTLTTQRLRMALDTLVTVPGISMSHQYGGRVGR